MFNNKNTNESDFCESYKSEILGTEPTKKEGSFFSTLLKLLTILILLAMVIAISIYGYNYFMNHKKVDNTVLPPISVQISDDDLVVEPEDEEENVEAPVEEKETNKSKVSLNEEANKTQKNVKEKQLAKEKVKNLEVPTAVPEAKYLEQLADLSKEIDKDKEKKK